MDHVHLGQVHVGEQPRHVGLGIGRHAALADAALGGGIVGVDAFVGNQVVDQIVEGLAEVAGHALRGQVVHALAGMLGQAVADDRLVGPVHELVLGGQVAPGVGILARGADLAVIDALDIVGEVGRLDGQAGMGFRIAGPGRRLVAEFLDHLLVSGFPRLAQFLRNRQGIFVEHRPPPVPVFGTSQTSVRLR